VPDFPDSRHSGVSRKTASLHGIDPVPGESQVDSYDVFKTLAAIIAGVGLGALLVLVIDVLFRWLS
jgi:hypothetical protein